MEALSIRTLALPSPNSFDQTPRPTVSNFVVSTAVSDSQMSFD